MSYSIGYDLDACVIDLHDAILNTYLRWSGRFFCPQDITTWRLEDVLGCTHHHIWKMINHVILNQESNPVVGAPESLQLLSEFSSLTVLSAREEFYRPYTEDWLHHHFVPYNKMILDHEKYKHVGSFNVMIEDNPEQAMQIAEAGCKVLLLDYPYNRDVRHKNIQRVHSWSEIVSWIKKDNK